MPIPCVCGKLSIELKMSTDDAIQGRRSDRLPLGMDEIGAALLQLHIAPHHLDDVDAIEQVLLE